jgi:hypothetical protein
MATKLKTTGHARTTTESAVMQLLVENTMEHISGKIAQTIGVTTLTAVTGIECHLKALIPHLRLPAQNTGQEGKLRAPKAKDLPMDPQWFNLRTTTNLTMNLLATAMRHEGN